MSSGDDSCRLLRVLDQRKRHVELDGKLVSALLGGEKTHPTADRYAAHLDVLAAGHHAERALKASGITHGEELLGVGAAAVTAHLRRPAQLDIEGPVARSPMTKHAAARDGGLSGVENSRCRGLKLVLRPCQ